MDALELAKSEREMRLGMMVLLFYRFWIVAFGVPEI